MTNKTMPERIMVLMNFTSAQVTPMCDRLEHDGTYSAADAESEHAMGTEYVRADLLQCDVNEPLEDGQYRWVRLSKDEGFIPATIHKDALRKDRLIYFICGNEMEDYVEDCYEWGPVIRPPEDV